MGFCTVEEDCGARKKGDVGLAGGSKNKSIIINFPFVYFSLDISEIK